MVGISIVVQKVGDKFPTDDGTGAPVVVGFIVHGTGSTAVVKFIPAVVEFIFNDTGC